MRAVQWCTPPESIKHIRHLFDDHPQLRSAYYALGNYIAALEVSVLPNVLYGLSIPFGSIIFFMFLMTLIDS
jgi:hypothetical protein